jgi:putative SOS response-associated peptidase YedK
VLAVARSEFAVRQDAPSSAGPTGYHEWQNTPAGKRPWYFTAADGLPLLTAAGLWDEWKDRQTGERLKSCTMIITEPNDFAAEIHDRMPVFLTGEQFAPGLRAERLAPEF